MLHMALVFLVIGLIAALLGFTTIAGASFAIAKFLAGSVSRAVSRVPHHRSCCDPPHRRLIDGTRRACALPRRRRSADTMGDLGPPRSSIEHARVSARFSPPLPSALRSRWPPALSSQTAPAPSLTLLSKDGRRTMPLTVTTDGQELVGARRSRRGIPADRPRGRARRDHRWLQGQDDRPHPGPGARVGGRPAGVAAGAADARPDAAGWCRSSSSAARSRSIYDARLDLRKPSRLLVVGDVRVPRDRRALRTARRGGAPHDRRDAARNQHRHAGRRSPLDQVRRRRARRAQSR